MIKWKDSTKYAQKDKERTPSTWKVDVNGYEVTVTRDIDYPDVWFFRCRTLEIDSKVLQSKDIIPAKHEAILLLKKELLDRVRKIQDTLGAIDQYQEE